MVSTFMMEALDQTIHNIHLIMAANTITIHFVLDACDRGGIQDAIKVKYITSCKGHDVETGS